MREYLDRCSRTTHSLPGSLTWKRRNGSEIPTRCDGSLVEPGPEPVIYLRCRPRKEAVERFGSLNDTIQALSREVQQRRSAAGTKLPLPRVR